MFCLVFEVWGNDFVYYHNIKLIIVLTCFDVYSVILRDTYLVVQKKLAQDYFHDST
jgi:hypothetical protein